MHARAHGRQVFRYCLNLNFREEYRVYDDIFALLHDDVQLRTTVKRSHSGAMSPRPQMKQIFITSFNLFKKALTCARPWPPRDRHTTARALTGPPRL